MLAAMSSSHTAAGTEAGRLRAAAAGDPAATSALYAAHFEHATRTCTRILGCAAEGEDAAQDALLACLARLPSLDTETLRFGAYVQAAAVRAAVGRLRSRRRLAPVAEVATNASLAADPAGQFEAAERRETVRAAVRTLPDRQRLALFRDAYEDRTRQAIAAELDLDTNAVGQLLWRARRTLETRLSAAA
jgi:RNA polymerase sigma-70 factor, ECF subfamily